MSDVPSNEVLAAKLDHVRETMDRLVSLAEKGATKDDVRHADEALDRRLTLVEGTVRGLQESKTEVTAAINLVRWVTGFVGVGGLLAFLKWLVTGSVT